jgi:hypothetical protein
MLGQLRRPAPCVSLGFADRHALAEQGQEFPFSHVRLQVLVVTVLEAPQEEVVENEATWRTKAER